LGKIGFMKKILLIVTGGIAAYRTLDLIREIKRQGDDVTCVLTSGAQQFVQPLSFGSLSGNKVYTELFDLNNESKMGHINLSRQHDLIVVAPATANIISKMSYGIADDLASTILLATDKPIMVVPSMNVKMWENLSTTSNVKKLKNKGIYFVGPNKGEMACGEFGYGKMALVKEISNEINFVLKPGPLVGKKALVTSGPTIESIDPIRFISNRSSGKQGHAIARMLGNYGAETTLISGPVNLENPTNVKVKNVNTADEMFVACKDSLPVDIAIFAAAVSDWRAEFLANQKIKKEGLEGKPLKISFTENNDILKEISTLSSNRPKLVIGFSLETENLIASAKNKLAQKSCDWIIANNYNNGQESVFNSEMNNVKFVNTDSEEDWGLMTKISVAEKLCDKISGFFKSAA
tara:strand:+ start:4561 stop:5781 length:1221 start_codon:yes stop_codon:yes gene_type:complete